MNRSESIKELATALCKAQAVIVGATKDKDNTAFKGAKYADLASCWDAVRKPLTDNGLTIMQFPRTTEIGVEVETMLTHTSGEFVSETLTVPLSKRDAHGVGSAVTYGRRFGLCAVVGVSPEDDDGNGAVSKDGKKEPPKSMWTTELHDLAIEAATKGVSAYQDFWKSLSEATRSSLIQTEEHNQFKATAKAADATNKAKETA